MQGLQSGEGPLLILLKGHPAVGKSAVALALAQLLRWPLVDKDDARDCFEGIAELAEVPPGILNSLAYKIMFRTASKQLLAGNSAIVDCPLSRISLYQEASVLADKHRAQVAVVECVTHQCHEWQQRLEARTLSDSADQAHKPCSWKAVQTLIAGYQGACDWTNDGSCKLSRHLVIDTSQGSPQELAASAAHCLGIFAKPSGGVA
ncbi:hypothetical protein WJX74_004082 [Apatococcus lobatus]|uniref:Uncharacterized protein n=1 Tax=Apatococcus lobatus TaxID=904363 RepID=A0AAW1R3F8_9CHLO